MTNLVDYEALQDGEDFIFIKTIMNDGSVDPRIGQNGPCGISFFSPSGLRISYPEALTPQMLDKMHNQFARKYLKI